MPRKLKTYTTSAGFFDLAVAAPSMKAALEAWGSNSNLFQHGLAKETGDQTIVAATMAKPGVVLRRPVGTDKAFAEHATLPSNFAAGLVGPPAAKRAQPSDKPPAKLPDQQPDQQPDKPTRKPAAEPVDEQATRKAAQSFQREQERRRRQEQKEEAARARERERRDRAIAAAEAALEDAGQAHRKKVDELDKARAALDRKLEAERERWREKKEELDRALRNARS